MKQCARYYASTTIRVRVIDGLTVVLDLKQDRYAVLDEIGTIFWHALTTTADQAQCLDGVGAAYEVTTATLERDLASFACVCASRGWLTTSPPVLVNQRAARVTRSPSIFLAWWALMEMLVLRKLTGIQTLYAMAVKRAVPLDNPTAHEQLGRALSAFIGAENFVKLPGGAQDCLPRSLALFAFLSRCGISSRHCIGVRRTPFEAHAWVEVDGKPVLENLDQRHYEILAEI